MKRLLLIIILICTAGFCSAKEAVKLELYTDCDAAQTTGGGKIITPAWEFRTSSRKEKHNIGFRFSSSKINSQFPAEIKFGNLSASGSLSKMNSPELSNGTSPFSDSVLTTSAVTASLPGYTSFSKPESTFLQLNINHLMKNPLNLTINLLSSPDNKSPVVSVMASEKLFSSQLTLSTSCTAGTFFYEENIPSSWFSDFPCYAEGSHLCSLFQFSADYKSRSRKTGLYSAFMAGIYETPFGPYTAVYRADLKLNVKQTEVYASAFLNAYEDTLTSSAKKLTPSAQFKAGIISKKPFLLMTQPVFLKTGINFYSRINLTKNEHPVRCNAGLQMSTEKAAVSLRLSTDAVLKSPSPEQKPDELENTSVSVQLKNSLYFKALSPSFSITAEKDLKTTSDMKYKIALNLVNNSIHKISGNSTISFSTKNGAVTDKKLTSGLTCRLNLKNLTVTGKVSYSTGF